MKTYYDNGLKEENTALRFQCSKTRDGVQRLMACMSDDQAHVESELHTVKDMRWNESDQRPIKY